MSRSEKLGGGQPETPKRSPKEIFTDLKKFYSEDPEKGLFPDLATATEKEILVRLLVNLDMLGIKFEKSYNEDRTLVSLIIDLDDMNFGTASFDYSTPKGLAKEFIEYVQDLQQPT